jgi:TolB-like protein/Tfp pilus assembly protein PilF
VFEADLESGELRKHGLALHLPAQSFQVLTMLLDRPGEILTRRELQERLWPEQTFSDRDHGLNKAVNRLRDVLNDSADAPRFIETIARKGYRLIVPVTGKATENPRAPSTARIRLVVLPFRNLSADSEQEFFSDGLTEEMIFELGRLSPDRLGIIARTSAMQYKDSSKRIDEIGKELNVHYVLEGSVRKVESRARIAAQLVHAQDQTHLWAGTYDRDVADIFQVQKDVAQSVADSLAFELLPEARSRGQSALPEAHESYLRGRFFWNKGDGNNASIAIEWYQKAVQRDPEYALAHAGIADCYCRLAWFSALPPLVAGAKAKEAAMRAVQIDPLLGDAHASLALLRFWYDWDWTEAGNEFRRSLELRPNYADAHNWYAAYLNVMGQFEEASAQQKLAEELDPLSLIIAMNGADPYYFSRQYAPAIEHLKRVLSRKRNFFPAYYNLGRAYAQSGDYQQAILTFEEAARLSGSREVSAPIAYAHARLGRVAEARKILGEIEEVAQTHYVAPPQLALIYLGLGDIEKTLALLDRGFDEKSFWMIYLKADPVYDPLRNYPRFKNLMNRLGFPSES